MVIFQRTRKRPRATGPGQAMWTTSIFVLASWLVGGSPGQAASTSTFPNEGSAADRTRNSGFGVRGHRPVGASIHVSSGGQQGAASDSSDARKALEAREAELVQSSPRPGAQWPDKWRRPELPIRWNERTAEYLRYFKQHPSGRRLIRGWFQRAAAYLPELRAQLRAAGLPADLAFVAMVESGLNPTRVSRTGAAGLWQFMPATGAAYGLDRSHWVDERFDVPASTAAATALLADLQSRFGSWELALAAYHAGFARVLTAMRRANSNDFWTLAQIESGLPLHSLNYPTKVLALAIVAQHPEEFQIDDISWMKAGHQAQATRYVEAPARTRLDRLAKRFGVDPTQFVELNAKFHRGRTPPSPKKIRVRVPIKQAEQTPAEGQHGNASDIQDNELTLYSVRLGESLDELALRFDMTPRELRRINGVRDSGELRPGTQLLVRAGKPVSGLPTVPELVAVPDVKHPPGRRRVFFRVNRATSMPALLRRVPITWAELVRWNELDPAARPFDGQWLQLFVPEGFDADAAGVRLWKAQQLTLVKRTSPAHVKAIVRERQLRRRAYTVKARDTWRRLERRFGLSRGSIARINRIERSRALEPGSKLLLYLEAGRTWGTKPAQAAKLHAPWLAEAHRPQSPKLLDEADCVDNVPQLDVDHTSSP